MAIIKGHNFPGGKTSKPSTKRVGGYDMPQVASAPPRGNVTESVTVRPIDNGYLIEKNKYTPGTGNRCGKSENSTTFSATKPKLGV